jgi:hypothetical protein
MNPHLKAAQEVLDNQAGQIQRLTDLVRYQRHALHDANLITDTEYVALMESGSVARLTTYDEMRSQSEKDAKLIEELKKLVCDRNSEVTALINLLEPLSNNEGLRAGLHGNYNGGHREDATREAFHHGMDTACNQLQERMDAARKYLLSGT